MFSMGGRGRGRQVKNPGLDGKALATIPSTRCQVLELVQKLEQKLIVWQNQAAKYTYPHQCFLGGYSGNYSLWMKFLLPKLRGELPTALNAIFVPISVSYFNPQWKVMAHWVRPSLVYTLFPVTACPHQFLGSRTKLIVWLLITWMHY